MTGPPGRLHWSGARGPVRLPAGTRLRAGYETSLLAGIGFTMSLFMACRGFGSREAAEQAKMRILLA